MIAEGTKDDDYLQSIKEFMQNGWPERVDKRFADVFANQHDLELLDDCVLYFDRVIIPQKYQKQTLDLLHNNHLGVVKMKQLARRMVYWFGINSDIEKYVAVCDACNSMNLAHTPKETSNWTPTTRPFSRIHIDFFFFEHRTFLLIVDSFSKWIEVENMRQGTDCNKVLKKLVQFFARFGLPDVLVSDNGPPFNSYKFVNFLEKQGIKVMKSPPYNPASNGQAERLVRTVKEVLKRFLLEPDTKDLDLDDQINLFLFNYRSNTLTKDGHFPSEKIFSYKPKSILDLLNPKQEYKQHLSIPKPHEERAEKSGGMFPMSSMDIFSSLMAGDEILVGSVEVMAHRNQIKVVKEAPVWSSPNVVVQQMNSHEHDGLVTRCATTDDGDEMNGARSGTVTAPRGATGRTKRRCSEIDSPGELRRSKRKRKVYKDEKFCYDF
ncbi:uncharacterized protein K02A2.6-like [Armigeres subalbatus]|uniref:uncharacterized protein K02A2.6-like n=1 Tax=Armigeres subalbatus TaxID=124917 RepID=UPI002ED4FD61